MCRSIKTLREPYVDDVTSEEVRAAALQYVRKVSGFRAPSRANSEEFEHAVADIAASTQRLLDALVLPPRKAEPVNLVLLSEHGAQ